MNYKYIGKTKSPKSLIYVIWKANHLISKSVHGELPGEPVVRTSGFHHLGPGLDSCLGN